MLIIWNAFFIMVGMSEELIFKKVLSDANHKI